MKKIININLSGRVIPIEDAAYESLQRYIESLRRYFATEEGRDEIINDIESRIAELMNEKLKKGTAAVTEADMEGIIASMGRIEDFEEVDAMDASSGSSSGATAGASEPFIRTTLPRGRLYRDKNDKFLGGVCSGIASYLNIDPAIVRILFVILTFGAGMSIFIYLLLWLLVPARPLPPKGGKRLFRNPDDRILGGVAGGIGAYLNKDTWMIRLIFAAPLLLNILFAILNGIFFAFHRDIFPSFVIGSFVGTFFIIYIILWIILPEAKNSYEKMEMRGETVDVNRIRQNVQEGMGDLKNRAQAWGEEVRESAENLGQRATQFASTQGTAFASEVRQSARPVASGIGHVIAVLFKSFFLFVAGVIAFFLFAIVIVFTLGGVARPFNDFILNGFWQSAYLWSTLIFFLAVPLIAIITWIVRRIMNVRSHSRYLGWTFGGLWTLGWVSLILFIASMAKDWRYYNNTREEITLAQPALSRMTVRIDEAPIRYTGNFDWIDDDEDGNGGWDLTADSLKMTNMKVRIEKSEDSSFHVAVVRYSAGRNRTDASNRAQKIVYTASSLDSALILGAGIGIGKNDKFRGQKVMIEIQVPVGRSIRFGESVVNKLNDTHIRIEEKRDGDYRYRREWDMDWDGDSYFEWKANVDYTMTAEGKLVDPLQPAVGPAERNEYRYEGVDSVIENRNEEEMRMQQQIEENQIRLQDEQRKLEEQQRRLEELRRDRDRTSSVIFSSDEEVRKTEKMQLRSPIFSMII